MSRPVNEPPLYDDEISLRDLYLILRRGLPVILGAAAIAGVIAFGVSSFLPDVFEAESTTLVSPQPVQVQGTQDLSFEPPNEVSFEAYETLANSRPVIEQALAEVPEAELNPETFGGDVSLLLGPPPNASEPFPLSMTHSVRNQDPELAAQLADAWALSTLEAVRASFLASLEPIRAATEQQIETLEATLETAEAEFETFQRTDRGGTLTALLANVAQQIADSEQRRDEVGRRLADARARVALLAESSSGETGTGEASNLSAAELADRVRLLQSREEASTPQPPPFLNPQLLETQQSEAQSNSPQLSLQSLDLQLLGSQLLGSQPDESSPERRLGQLEALLSLQPDESSLSGSVTGLLNRADLRDFTVDIAGLEAEQTRITRQLAGYQTRLDELLTEAAQLNLQRGRLQRTLNDAREAYSDVALLEPIISYVTTIAPANARLLNSASVPSAPAGPRTLFNAALAAVLAALLATLFVFLREAVRAPPATPARAVDTTEAQADPLKST